MNILDDIEDAVLLDAQGNLEGAVIAYRAGFKRLANMLNAERDSDARRRAIAQFQEFEKRARDIEEFLCKQQDGIVRSTAERARIKRLCETERDLELEMRHKFRQKSAWQSVCGLDNVIRFLDEQLLLPCRFAELFASRRNNARSWKSILLYGPPGVGKRHLLNVLSDTLTPLAPRVKVFRLPCAQLCSGATKRADVHVRAVFAEALLRITEGKASVVLIDDLDLVNTREPERVVCLSDGMKWRANPTIAAKVKAELLLGMREIKMEHNGLFIVACTDRPWDLCSALRRRYDKRLLCTLPDEKGRTALVDLCLKTDKQNGKESDAERQSFDVATVRELVVKRTKGHSAGIICAAMRSALTRASQERQSEEDHGFLKQPFDRIEIRSPTLEDFEFALGETISEATLSKADLERYGTALPQ